MTTGFQREANALLKTAGYEYVTTNGSGHEVWRKADLPDIHVPGTPSGGRDSMLARVGRAIRKGTALTPPSGQEKDMGAPAKEPAKRPLGEKLVALATPHMVKVAADKRERVRTGNKTRRDPDPKYNIDCGKWVRRCIEAHGKIHNADFAYAAEQLMLSPTEMSAARTYAGATAYKRPGDGKSDLYTDFIGRIPKDAITWGGRNIKGKDMPQRAKKPANEVKTSWQEPQTPAAPPNGNEGRRLEQGGLTPEQHAAAEQRMVDAHRTAEAERQAILARREESVEAVRGETNGRPKSQLDAAMELLREAALADTHALTKEDIQALRGMAEMHRRQADEHTAAAGMIRRLLERVAPGVEREVAA